MITNKTFYGMKLLKGGQKKTPLKEKSPGETSRGPSKSIVKLPLVKNSSILECKNYQLGDPIGEGAFAKVYVAKRTIDGLKCVIKLIQKSKVNTEQRKKALKRQLQVLSLPKHKNLVNSIDKFETSTQIGIVMEHFSSQTLTSYIKLHRPLQNSALQSMTKQICQGLLYLHSHGMSHRDIKPDNILINENGQIKIIDFGFATTQQLDQVVIAGTPQYMAPQLIMRKNYDPLKADIWSFGIMLYWLALGYFPQDADNKKKISSIKKWEDFKLHFPVDINPGLQYLLQRMLNPDPAQRVELSKILEDTWVKPKALMQQIKKLRQTKNVGKNTWN